MDLRSTCSVLFWIKVYLSILIVVACITIQSFLIYHFHSKGAIINSFINSPNQIELPSLRSDLKCDASLFRARLEPDDNQFLWGFSIQWDVDDAIKLTERLGKTVPIFNTFININNTDFEVDILNWQAQQVQQLGGMLEITLLPKVLISEISDEMLYRFATQMRKINSYYGVPVFLRYGPEMNGNWMEYFGQRPSLYIPSFQKLANYVHRLTNLTAMVWSPNVGAGYPFSSNEYNHITPKPGSVDFNALDTNKDGVINNYDDPYLPYYPGDQYVDWVGLSAYNFERDAATQQALSASLNSVYSFVTASPASHLSFYDRFSRQRDKPFILAETGSAWDSNQKGHRNVVLQDSNSSSKELETKISWLKSIINAIGMLPKFKAAVWFEEKKDESSYSVANVRVIRDYRITFTSSLRKAFLTTLSDGDSINYVWADSVDRNKTYLCSGILKF